MALRSADAFLADGPEKLEQLPMAHVPFDGFPSGVFTAAEHIIPGNPCHPRQPRYSR
jgi:hypothetical protein